MMVLMARAKFIEPMLLLRSESLPEGTEWAYELKLDGYRALGIKANGKVQLRSRNDNELRRTVLLARRTPATPCSISIRARHKSLKSLPFPPRFRRNRQHMSPEKHPQGREWRGRLEASTRCQTDGRAFLAPLRRLILSSS